MAKLSPAGLGSEQWLWLRRGSRSFVPTRHDAVAVFKGRLIYGIGTALVLLPCPTAALGEVVTLVGVQFGWGTSWSTRTLADRRHGIDRRLRDLAVMPVRGRDPQGEGDAVGIDQDVALEPRPSGSARPPRSPCVL